MTLKGCQTQISTEMSSNEMKVLRKKQSNNLEFKRYNYDESHSKNDYLLSDMTSSTNGTEYFSRRYFKLCRCCWKIKESFSRDLMLRMDNISKDTRNYNVFIHRSKLNNHHRVILLDWLMEICHSFRLSRDTYSHSLDYLDRFLTISLDVDTTNLQLVGITCLHIAIKYEEVHSMKLLDLIYLSDNLISEEDVLEMERKILFAIDWRCSTWTVNKWLFVLIHIARRKLTHKEYKQLTYLIDLVTLDEYSLLFSYSVLASVGLYLVTSVKVCFPYDEETHELLTCECLSWMEPYWKVIRENNIPVIERSVTTDQHSCTLVNESINQSYNNIMDVYRKIKNSVFDERV